MKSKKQFFFNFFSFIFSLLVLILVWIIVSRQVDSELIIPSPKLVFKQIYVFLNSVDFWINLFFTFLRVTAAFLISMILGSFIGIICGKNIYVKKFFQFPVSFIRVCPVISIILVVLYWFDSTVLPAFVAVLMTLPVMITSIIKSYDNKNQKLLDMAFIYDYSPLRKFLYIEIPDIKPYFIAALENVFGLTWKVVIAGEVMCIPQKGIGSLLQTNSIHLEASSVFALTIIVVCISYFIQMFFALISHKSKELRK